MNNTDLAARIAAIEDREAIADLVYRYAEAVRNMATSECVELMTEDAVIELRHADPHRAGASTFLNRFVGRQQIAASFAETAGSDARIWPMIHNLRIELAGDLASAVCVMMSAIWPHGKEYVGEYRDTFRREVIGWRFSSRTYTVFGDTSGRYSVEAHADYVSVKGQGDCARGA